MTKTQTRKELQKLTFEEASDLCWKANKEGKTISVVAVISKDSFEQNFTELERSYKFTNDNKRFKSHCIGNSIFADCLDGKDLGVRLDWYIFGGGWVVDYCYILGDAEK